MTRVQAIASATRQTLLPQAALGNYRLIREVARGSFCTLQLASSHDGSRPRVLVKQLVVNDPLARARLLREGRLGLRQHAPGLVRVLEIHDDPASFLVMDYVEGLTLSALLARAGTTDISRCLVPIFLDALRALAVLHAWRDEAGVPGMVVHQQPSARHLLVGADGATRVIDLSHAQGRQLGPAPGAGQSLLRSELAPEQLTDPRGLDPRCDLYILGCALQGALAQTARQIGRTRIEGLLEVCRCATAPRRSDRYWSADEMGYALEAAASGAGLNGSRQEVASWVRKLQLFDVAAPQGAALPQQAQPAVPVPPSVWPEPPPMARSGERMVDREPPPAGADEVVEPLDDELEHLLELEEVGAADEASRSTPLMPPLSSLAHKPTWLQRRWQRLRSLVLHWRPIRWRPLRWQLGWRAASLIGGTALIATVASAAYVLQSPVPEPVEPAATDAALRVMPTPTVTALHAASPRSEPSESGPGATRLVVQPRSQTRSLPPPPESTTLAHGALPRAKKEELPAPEPEAAPSAAPPQVDMSLLGLPPPPPLRRSIPANPY